MTPTVSAIVPAYNAERYLAETLHSILHQTAPVHEIIVIDDGSTDGTVEVARQFPVRLIQLQHGGQSVARNTGVQQAGGTLLAFLDADDIWAPDKTERQQAILDADADIDMVFGWVQQFHSPELTPDERLRYPCPSEPQHGLVPGAMLVRKVAFLKVGEFDTQYAVGEFIDWYSRAREAHCTHHTLDGVVLNRRIHSTNTTSRDRSTDYARVVAAALRRKRQSGS